MCVFCRGEDLAITEGEEPKVLVSFLPARGLLILFTE